MTERFLAAAISSILLTVTFPLAGGPGEEGCDPGITSPTKDTTLAYKRRGSLCEGFYDKPSRGEKSNDFDLISFTLSEIDFSCKADSVLYLSVGADVDSVKIRGLVFPSGYHFQMDGLVVKGSHLEWRPKSVFCKMSILPNNVRLFGWKQGKDSPVYFPVNVSTRLGPLQDSALPRISLRAKHGVKGYRFMVYSSKDGARDALLRKSRFQSLSKSSPMVEFAVDPILASPVFVELIAEQENVVSKMTGRFLLDFTGLDSRRTKP